MTGDGLEGFSLFIGQEALPWAYKKKERKGEVSIRTLNVTSHNLYTQTFSCIDIISNLRYNNGDT
jgi:hypothetical protein